MIPFVAGAGTIHSRVNSFAVQFPDRVLLYSGYLRKWVTLPVSASAIVTPQNDHTLIVDGQTLHGWSPRYGTVDSITVSLGAALLPAPPSATYVVVVQDGNDYHAYGAAAAHWSTLSLATPAVAAVQHRRCALVHDGTTLYGYSSYSGNWVPTSAPEPGITLHASGDVGIAKNLNIVRGFSAPTSTWSLTGVNDSTNMTLEASHGYIEDANGDVVTFSGTIGGFSSYATNGAYTIAHGSEVLAVEDANGVNCYSSIRGAWSSHAGAGGSTLLVGDDLVVATNATECVAYSAVLGQFSTPLGGIFSATVGNVVAFVDDGANRYGYSALRNDWVPAPALPVVSVRVVGHSIVLSHGNAFSGLGARYGAWQTLASSPTATLTAATNRPGTVMVTDTASVSCWNGRINRWAQMHVDPGTLSNTSVRFSSVLLADPTRAFVFDVSGTEFEGTVLSGTTIVTATAGSGVSYVQTNDHLHLHTQHETLSSPAAFPESDGFAPVGGILELQQAGIPGSGVLLVFGINPASLLTTYGELLVDSPVAGAAPVIPSSGRLQLDVAVPFDASLIGLPLHVQCGVLPPAGLPYLTGSISPFLL